MRSDTLPRAIPGPVLLRPGGPSLAAHRAVHGALRSPPLGELVMLLWCASVRGRGGAGFPVAEKLAVVGRKGRRAPVVVNLSEGEPGSRKDHALATVHPHLVLDGAQVVASALRSRSVHLVVPVDAPDIEAALTTALRERHSRAEWRIHRAAGGFVSGEGSAVVELIEGRANLPVTTRLPTALAGLRGRPTLLSNAETFAQVAAVVADPDGYSARGTPQEPGTRLLTLGRAAGPVVIEVEHGSPWTDVLPTSELRRPVLLGGYHGSWAPAGALIGRTVSTADLAELGLTLGAGVVLPLPDDGCPLVETAWIVSYLAEQSARRCGPCLNGLPALADALADLVAGEPALPRVHQLVGLVDGRGACAHPDGTARLVRSALTAFPSETVHHGNGLCSVGTTR